MYLQIDHLQILLKWFNQFLIPQMHKEVKKLVLNWKKNFIFTFRGEKDPGQVNNISQVTTCFENFDMKMPYRDQSKIDKGIKNRKLLQTLGFLQMHFSQLLKNAKKFWRSRKWYNQWSQTFQNLYLQRHSEMLKLPTIRMFQHPVLL